MKHGQIQSQIFVYIMAIVIVGLIMIFGYNAVRNFAEKSDQVAAIQFKTSMEGTFKTMATSYKQVKIMPVSIPTGYDEVCFVNIDYKELKEEDFAFNPLLFAGVQEKKNIFLIKGIDFEGYRVGKITVDSDGNKCLKTAASNCDPLKDAKFGGDGEEKAREKILDKSGFGNEYVLCIPAKGGKINLKLKGWGDHVFVAVKT